MSKQAKAYLDTMDAQAREKHLHDRIAELEAEVAGLKAELGVDPSAAIVEVGTDTAVAAVGEPTVT